MKLEDFKIGECFWCGDQEWYCSDKGTRIIAAINVVNAENAGVILSNPPYFVSEIIFDEYDFPGCSPMKVD